jgi:hypothetical protein
MLRATNHSSHQSAFEGEKKTLQTDPPPDFSPDFSFFNFQSESIPVVFTGTNVKMHVPMPHCVMLERTESGVPTETEERSFHERR